MKPARAKKSRTIILTRFAHLANRDLRVNEDERSRGAFNSSELEVSPRDFAAWAHARPPVETTAQKENFSFYMSASFPLWPLSSSTVLFCEQILSSSLLG